MATKITFIDNETGVRHYCYMTAEEAEEFMTRDGFDITVLNVEEMGA